MLSEFKIFSRSILKGTIVVSVFASLFGFALTNVHAADSLVLCSFTRDVSVGTSGEDVKCLQQYLNATGYEIAKNGTGAKGNESVFFGKQTKNALINWQKANGIIPATGYFGASSRLKYQTLVSVKIKLPVEPTTPVLVPVPETSSTVTPETVTSGPAVEAVKSGNGVTKNDGFFDVGIGKLYYVGGDYLNGRGYISAGDPEVLIGNLSGPDVSSCEQTKAYSYLGLSNFCRFIDINKFTFTKLPKEGVRFHDKSQFSCSGDIMMFKQNGLYGATEFEKVDKENQLSYKYWYDTSGGANFSSLCATAPQANKTKSVFDVLASIFHKIEALFSQ